MIREALTAMLFALVAIAAFGQQPEDRESIPVFQANLGTVNITPSSGAIVIHLPAGSSRRVLPLFMSINPSGQCEFQQEVHGGTPTGTAVAATQLGITEPAALLVYHSATVSSGTALKPLTLSSGEQNVSLDMLMFRKGASTGQNFIFRPNNCTITAKVAIFWKEKSR